MVIQLYSGVAFCLRRFRPLISELVHGAWAQWVRRQNLKLIGETTDLHSFLFGTERSNLAPVREVLQEIQNRCFYCDRSMRTQQSVVDHFVPWALYPVDLGHNFVLAHVECNSQKRDLLAAEDYLAAWTERNFGMEHSWPRSSIVPACSTVYRRPPGSPYGLTQGQQPPAGWSGLVDRNSLPSLADGPQYWVRSS